MSTITILGALGRMGQALARQAHASTDLTLHAALVRRSHPRLGQPALPTSDLLLSDDLNAALSSSDAVIDFTHPDAVRATLYAAVENKTSVVMGTTGLQDAHHALLRSAAEQIPIVYAPNMSVGVNVMLDLLTMAAKALGDGYDLEVLEAHHKHKVDAPSGTALRIAQALCEARGVGEEALVYGRHGQTGARSSEEIGMQVIRGGDVAGDHTVFFLGEGERIEIAHRASSREVFAQGALRAARWIVGKPAGLYSMRHVLGLETLS